MKKELIINKLPTDFCHASTLAAVGGVQGIETLACWFGGSHEGADDVGQDAAAAQGAEQHPSQADHRGVHAEILSDPAADAAEHLALLDPIELPIHNGLLS